MHSNQKTVGHYIMGKSLGEGTFGKVKLGTHILTGEKVAIKVLEKSRIKDYKDVERINREIKILKQVHHPNVVQLYEIIETEKELYLIMEFVYGGELFDYIVSHQRLKEKVASKLFQEMVAALNYIHSIGICHRDLKPENILLCYDKTIKIVDFGLSNMYKPDELLKTACGSPCYAAPEMIAGQKYYGLKSDLWSAGVVLYAMLCGFLPYEDQKTSNLYKKIMSAEYTMPKFLSAEAQSMIDSLFQTDPAKRINVEQIREHPFYLLHSPETVSFGLTRNLEDPKRVNPHVLANLEDKLGFSQQSVLKAIATNRHNHMTATYYLLLKKQFMAEKRPYADSFKETNSKFREVHHKQVLRDTKDFFEKTAGSVDPNDLVKFSQRGEKVAQKVGIKNEKRGQSQDPNRQRRAEEEYYRDEEIEENARRRGDSAQRADPEEEMGILTSKFNKDRERSRSKQREYVPQQFLDQRQNLHSAVSHQPVAKLNATSRNEAHTLQELSPEGELEQTQQQSRGVESLLSKLKEEVNSPVQNRSFVLPKSNYAQVLGTKQAKEHINIVSQYCAPSAYEQQKDEQRIQTNHKRANSFNESQSFNKSSYQTQQSSQKYSVEKQISSPGSSKEVSKVLKLAQNTENLKKLMQNVTNIAQRNIDNSAKYSSSRVPSSQKRGHVRGKSDVPQQPSFLDRVPQMQAYQNGEHGLMEVKQNNFVEPNLEMTSISLNQERRHRNKHLDQASERLSGSQLGHTVATKENSELDSLKNTQLLFQGAKVQATHKKNRTQFIDPSSMWTNSSNGVVQDLSQSVLLSKNSPPKQKPKHSNQELAKFMNQPLAKGAQVLDSQQRASHSRNHSNSSTQNKKKSMKPSQRVGQSATYSSSQRSQLKHTRTRSHGQQQAGPQPQNTFSYNTNHQPQASFDLNINISALYRQYQQIKRNSKQYNRSSQAKAAPAKSQMNNSMGKAIADNTIAAIDFMNKTFNYGTTTSQSRASGNQTRTEIRSKPISNILSLEQQNSRSAGLNSSYGPDYKKKKASTQSGTQVKNSVQGTSNLFNTTQNYVGGVVPPPSYKPGSSKKGRKPKQ